MTNGKEAVTNKDWTVGSDYKTDGRQKIFGNAKWNPLQDEARRPWSINVFRKENER